MKVALVSIGNSKGIRIPKPIIQKCHLKDSVDLTIKGDQIIITPDIKAPRNNWDKAFKMMNKNKEDNLIISDSMDLGDWEWK